MCDEGHCLTIVQNSQRLSVSPRPAKEGLGTVQVGGVAVPPVAVGGAGSTVALQVVGGREEDHVGPVGARLTLASVVIWIGVGACPPVLVGGERREGGRREGGRREGGRREGREEGGREGGGRGGRREAGGEYNN